MTTIILSARASAVLARRLVSAHPDPIGRAALLAALVDAGAEPTRAERGIELAVAREWITADGATLTAPSRAERAA